MDVTHMLYILIFCSLPVKQKPMGLPDVFERALWKVSARSLIV